jgi:hypothetical protein
MGDAGPLGGSGALLFSGLSIIRISCQEKTAIEAWLARGQLSPRKTIQMSVRDILARMFHFAA